MKAERSKPELHIVFTNCPKCGRVGFMLNGRECNACWLKKYEAQQKERGL